MPDTAASMAGLAAVRTLLVSDLHLGARLGRDVLRRPAALAALLAAIDEADRLVLLGDIVEMLEGHPWRALEAAAPVLRAIGARVGAGREVVVVPGNHDGALLAPWLRGHPRATATLAGDVPGDATRCSRRSPGFLAPARVTCATRASGCGPACGPRTATTSTATCCPSRPTGCPAARWAGCRVRAPRRPTTSTRAARR